MAELRREALAYEAGDGVVAATGGEGHDETDRMIRIGGRRNAGLREQENPREDARTTDTECQHVTTRIGETSRDANVVNALPV